ncbi:MAG: DNA polymerase/3'-5' exonuclease PolX, partial [Cyclobacteriaceae bacterium]|nr:DNA polymerase/3'-5' exonuclease PolX [Cyclobacteriaceae bacterium]
MTNKEIAKLLKLTASLLELHDENQFKIRTYTNAVFNIEKQQEILSEKNKEELEKLEGIGKGLAQSIVEIKQTGSFTQLDELISKTPEGILEMIDLKGIGPKKIKVVWKQLNIESIDQLYDACKLGSLAKLKGFGAKTQESIMQNLEYLISQRG